METAITYLIWALFIFVVIMTISLGIYILDRAKQVEAQTKAIEEDTKSKLGHK
jgi:hypothetical protein